MLCHDSRDWHRDDPCCNDFTCHPHLTPLTRCAVPTPMMDEEITCVVETGKWINVAPKIIDAEAKSLCYPIYWADFHDFTANRFDNFIASDRCTKTHRSSLLTKRTQKGISSPWCRPPAISAKVIIPLPSAHHLSRV